MSNEQTNVDEREDRLVVEDTPENRAWIGETEPQPVEEDSK